jgi:hypothetical protein
MVKVTSPLDCSIPIHHITYIFRHGRVAHITQKAIVRKNVSIRQELDSFGLNLLFNALIISTLTYA